jgi:hypothetical protein
MSELTLHLQPQSVRAAKMLQTDSGSETTPSGIEARHFQSQRWCPSRLLTSLVRVEQRGSRAGYLPPQSTASRASKILSHRQPFVLIT